MDQEEKLCNNCNLNIAAQNHMMHELHCARHMELCNKCRNPIPKEKMIEHLSAEHTNINCQHCNELVEKSILHQHAQTDCPKRILICPFCELELPACNMNKHTEYCGTRTEQCPDCKELVMIKYKALHLDSNHTFLKLDDEPGPVASWKKGAISIEFNKTRRTNEDVLLPCELCDEMFTAKELKRHQVSCFHGWDTTIPLLRNMSINTCDICNKPIASGEYEAHRIICSQLPTCSQSHKDNVALNRTELIPCDICNDLVAFKRYERHHRMCTQMQEQTELTHKSDKAQSKTKFQEESHVPCHTCRKPISITNYVEHRSTCSGSSIGSNAEYISLTKVACEYCGEKFDQREMYNHQRHCAHESLTPELIPCEFCHRLQSEFNILQHQLKCKGVNDF